MRGNPKRRSERVVSFKLRPELVPQPLWGVSACKLLNGRAPWKAIRIAELSRAGHRCETCTSSSVPLFCHEQWKYDDHKAITTLTGFHIACSDCNLALHMGIAHLRGEFDKALTQLCQVNKITEEEANRLFNNARAVWKRRSEKHWRVGVVPRLLVSYPQLKVLVGLDTRRTGPARDLRFVITGKEIVRAE